VELQSHRKKKASRQQPSKKPRRFEGLQRNWEQENGMKEVGAWVGKKRPLWRIIIHNHAQCITKCFSSRVNFKIILFIDICCNIFRDTIPSRILLWSRIQASAFGSGFSDLSCRTIRITTTIWITFVGLKVANTCAIKIDACPILRKLIGC
jgi:hypothetical protein